MMKGLKALLKAPWRGAMDAETYLRLNLRVALLSLLMFVPLLLLVIMFVGIWMLEPELLTNLKLPAKSLDIVLIALLLICAGVFFLVMFFGIKLLWLRGKHFGRPWQTLLGYIALVLISAFVSSITTEYLMEGDRGVGFMVCAALTLAAAAAMVWLNLHLYFRNPAGSASAATTPLLAKAPGKFEGVLLFLFQVNIWFVMLSAFVFPFLPPVLEDTSMMPEMATGLMEQLPIGPDEAASSGDEAAPSDMVLDEGFDLSPTDQPNP